MAESLKDELVVVSDDEGELLDDSILDALNDAIKVSEAEMSQTTAEPIPIGDDMSIQAPYGPVGARGKDPTSPQMFSLDKEPAIMIEDSMEGIEYTPEHSHSSKAEDMSAPVSKIKVKRDKDDEKPLPSSIIVGGAERSAPTEATEMDEDLFSESSQKENEKRRSKDGRNTPIRRK